MVMRRPSGSMPQPHSLAGMRVLQRLDDVGGIGVAGVHLRRGAARRVVAKRDEIDGVLRISSSPGCFAIVTLFPGTPARPTPDRRRGPDIDKEQVFAVLLQRHPYIFRLAGVRVEITAGQHTADLILRVNLMGDFRRQRAGHQLVMRGLILHLLGFHPLQTPDRRRSRGCAA